MKTLVSRKFVFCLVVGLTVSTLFNRRSGYFCHVKKYYQKRRVRLWVPVDYPESATLDSVNTSQINQPWLSFRTRCELQVFLSILQSWCYRSQLWVLFVMERMQLKRQEMRYSPANSSAKDFRELESPIYCDVLLILPALTVVKTHCPSYSFPSFGALSPPAADSANLYSVGFN